jgi:hypothetical protein
MCLVNFGHLYMGNPCSCNRLDEFDSQMLVVAGRITSCVSKNLLLTHTVGEASIKAIRAGEFGEGFCAVPT